MKKKDLVTGGLYAYQSYSERYWGQPILAIAAGPMWLRGPNLTPTVRGYYVVDQARQANGVPVLMGGRAQYDAVYEWAVSGSTEPAPIPEEVFEHVRKVAALLRKATAIDSAIDLHAEGFAPEGWRWATVNSQKLVDEYAVNARQHAERVKASNAQVEAERANLQRNTERMNAIRAFLEQAGVEPAAQPRFQHFTGQSSTAEPEVLVPLATLERLLRP